MYISITFPGFELSLGLGAAYVEVGKLFAAGLTASTSGGPFWGASRFEGGNGFQLVAGPLTLDIGRP